ncbi:MAG TPA: response regulator transcription factor [Longimicrobiales bacterium]|nr:response regulator transcription factor [Longimicrobiales bacterium]
MIRVIVAEDQSMVRGALAALLGLESDIEIVAEVGNGADALAQVEQLKPDVLITDIEMPELSGLDVARQISQRKLPTRVIIVTTFARAGYLRRAMDAGALGYLLKDNPAHQLAEAVRNVHAGVRAIDPDLAREAWVERDPLSDRERKVLQLAGEGLSSAAIAQKLSLSDGTVRNYLSDAIAKLGASNRTEAARLAREKGWL